MSDETLHPDPGTADETLASLYVDDQLSAAERAQVESSPETMALVHRFAEQRNALAEVPPATDAVRESAVAAALSQFTMVAPPPNVVSIDTRRRTRWLTAAAAVALIGVGGAVVAGMVGGSDQSTAEVQNAVVDAGRTDRNAPPLTEAGEIEASGGTAEDTFVDPTGGAGAPTVNGVESTLGAINGPVSAVPELQSTADLRTVEAASSPVVPSFELGCTIGDGQEVLAEITWNGTPALVVRDTVTGVITALDSQCTALASVAP